MSEEPRYDFTIAVSRVGDPDFREQATITNCPITSLLLKNTFLQAELLNRLIAKLNRRIDPPVAADSDEIKFEGEITVSALGAGCWPPGNIQEALV